MAGIAVAIGDISQLVGWNITAQTRPTDAATQAMIDETLTLIEGALKSRGCKIPIDDTESPHAAAIVTMKLKDFVAARVRAAHHTQLENVPNSFYRDIREREKQFHDWLREIQVNKQVLDDLVQLDSYVEVRSRGDFLANPANKPTFSVKDVW